jgi:hypothetical protein
LPEKLQGRFEFWTNSHTSFEQNKISFFLKTWPLQSKINEQYSAENMSFADKTSCYYSELFISPYFLKITNYLSDTPTVNMGLTDLYSNICTENCHFTEIPYYKYFNNQIIVFSEYSDKLFIINPEKLKIEKQVKITSKYTPVGEIATIIDKDIIESQMDQQNVNRIAKGRISNILFDKRSQNYLIVVKHKDLLGKDFKTNKLLNCFSIIVLNKNFEQVDEVLFNKMKYNPITAIMTDEGLALEEIDINNTQKNKKTYAIFQIN